MTTRQTHDRALMVLLAIGTALMATLAVKGVVLPKPPKPPGADGPVEPAVFVRHRRIPPLTVDQIRASGLSLREAMFYKRLPDRKVQCYLCPVMCALAEGERGQCATRINIDGILRTLVYGRPVAKHYDPIEKKPLFHFLPGAHALSIATAGCNLGCVFCQNWQISQALPEKAPHGILSPEELVAEAKRAGVQTIAYTYTEPTIFYEYMIDTARLARKEGIRNLWITCGYINPDPLRKLCRYMDAANVDLKGFDEDFYRKYCKASLEPVLTTLKIAREEGVWIEVTNLLIPGANDDPDMIRDLCKWHVANLGPDVPIHFSRFHPDYQLLNKPPTPIKTLETAAQIAREEGIRHVYIGNVATPRGDNTYCHKCGHLLIQRRRYVLLRNNLKFGACPKCGAKAPGVWTLSPKPTPPTGAGSAR